MSEQVPERLLDNVLSAFAMQYEAAYTGELACKQLSERVKRDQDPKWKRPYRMASFLLSISGIVFATFGYTMHNTELYAFAGVCFVVAAIATLMPSFIIRPHMDRDKQNLAELSDEQERAKRIETLKQDYLRLAWMIQARILEYNKVFDAIEATDMSYEWKLWAKRRMLPWYLELAGEMKVYGLYASRIGQNDPHIKRLRRFMELNPEEFVELCNLTGGRL
jgi:hypothetical protein